jgi:hypothetical protein
MPFIERAPSNSHPYGSFRFLAAARPGLRSAAAARKEAAANCSYCQIASLRAIQFDAGLLAAFSAGVTDGYNSATGHQSAGTDRPSWGFTNADAS